MSIKTSKLKTAMGVVLVLIAIVTLLFWEAEGREMLLMENVLVADADIKAGNPVGPDLFRSVSVPSGALVDSALSEKDEAFLAGKEASVNIVKGAQLSKRYLKDADERPKPETSYFIIRNEWINMCTSSLRRGDDVLVVSSDGKTVLGLYPVAFVKDGDGREVTDATSGLYSFSDAPSDRVNSSAPVHQVEIKCGLAEYRRIIDYCAGKPFAPLMLIRKDSAQ